MAVSTGTAEDGAKDVAVRSDILHGAADFHLGFTGWNVQLAFQFQLVWNVGKQLIDGGKPDRFEHLLLFF